MNKLSLILGAVALAGVAAALLLYHNLSGRIADLVTELAQTQSRLHETQGRLEVAAQQNKDLSDRVARTDSELGGAKARATTLAQQNSMARMEIAALTRRLDDAVVQSEEKESTITRLKRELVDLRMTPEHNKEEQTAALRDTIARLENEIERLQEEIRQSHSASPPLANGTSSTGTAPDLLTSAANRPTLRRQLLSVSEAGDVAAVEIGIQDGVQVGMTVLLMRGSRAIARLNITRVEETLSLGRIDPAFGSPQSLKKGETITIVLP